jgi:hypothetical protein
MAIANGDSVFSVTYFTNFSVLEATPLRGSVSGVAAGTCRIDWANGASATSVPVGTVAKVLDAPANPLIQIGKIFRLAGGSQEMLGALADAFIAEEDDGNQRGFALLAIIDRNGIMGASFALVEVDPTFANFGARLVPQPDAKSPRW